MSASDTGPAALAALEAGTSLVVRGAGIAVLAAYVRSVASRSGLLAEEGGP
jgi:hypothetical protein